MEEQTVPEIAALSHKIVWEYRYILDEIWPPPIPKHAAEFTVTEVAEGLDAELRQHPEYARNNAKDIDPLDEWADALMMALSIFREHENVTVEYLVKDHVSHEVLRDLAVVTAAMLNFYLGTSEDTNEHIPYYRVRLFVTLITILGKENTIPRLRSRLERIERKRVEEAGAENLFRCPNCTKYWKKGSSVPVCDCGEQLKRHRD